MKEVVENCSWCGGAGFVESEGGGEIPCDNCNARGFCINPIDAIAEENEQALRIQELRGPDHPLR